MTTHDRDPLRTQTPDGGAVSGHARTHGPHSHDPTRAALSLRFLHLSLTSLQPYGSGSAQAAAAAALLAAPHCRSATRRYRHIHMHRNKHRTPTTELFKTIHLPLAGGLVGRGRGAGETSRRGAGRFRLPTARTRVFHGPRATATHHGDLDFIWILYKKRPQKKDKKAHRSCIKKAINVLCVLLCTYRIMADRWQGLHAMPHAAMAMAVWPVPVCRMAYGYGIE